MTSYESRYNETYTWGNVKFKLEAFTPQQDECRLLMIKVVEQAVRDYMNLEHSAIPIEQQYYQTAIGFIFDDDYRVDYGSTEMSFADILTCIFDDSEGEVQWAREKIRRQKLIKKRSKKKRKQMERKKRMLL